MCKERMFWDEMGLGLKTNMEWFSALEVAKHKKSSKNQHKCLPISRTRS
jgi:hypothetical protein